MKRLIALLFGTTLLIALSACSPSRSGSLGPAPTGIPPSTTPATSSPAPEESPSASPDAQPTSTITIQVWLTQGDKLYPTRRTRPHTFTTSRLALTELIAGPSIVEAEAGVLNAIAGDTTFEIKGIAAGVATVNFPASFYAGGRDVARLRQAQVVYTLTQFPSVTRVGFQSAGEPAGWPVGRADYADLLPRIVVMSPVIGQRISSPVTVSGTADVSESTVSLRILDAAGNEIATRFTTATCGNGCRGDYSMTVPYQLCGERAGIVEVYAVSSEDGSRVSVVGIPVVFGACPR